MEKPELQVNSLRSWLKAEGVDGKSIQPCELSTPQSYVSVAPGARASDSTQTGGASGEPKLEERVMVKAG
ncbi:hypothetical protein BaRGS_00006760 [Batillaria attramentaria]|uniref:Uncharacterized protein n=1 Tax=Batillaria attramentaria TaxID=370345 RepID=A0ABD0LSF6_9CAEN